MKKLLLDRQHLMDYTLYGILSAIFFSITVWLYLYDPEFRQLSVIYTGSGFFTFIIMLYMVKLAQEQNNNSKEMVFAGHLSTIAGILVSVGICLFLCFVYKPEIFLSPAISSHLPAASLFHVFLPAILVNFFAGSFISILIGSIMKWNLQAKGKSISL